MERLKEIPRNEIIQGSSLEVLKTLPSESVDMIMTSPPYWSLRDYDIEGQIGLEPTLEEYHEKLLAITYELKRILKKTGVMYWNHGDCYATGAKESGEGIERKTGINSNTMMSQRRQVGEAGVPPKCLVLQNWRLLIKMLDEQGWILRNTLIWNKPNSMPSSVQDRYANTYEPIYMLVKQGRYWFDLDAVRVSFKEWTKKLYEYKNKGQWDYGSPKYQNSLGTSGFWASGRKRKSGFVRTRNLKYNSKYAKGSEFEQKYGNPYDRFGKNTKKSQKFITPEQQKQTQDKTGWKDGSGRIRSFFDNYGGKSNPHGKNPGDVWQISDTSTNQKSLEEKVKNIKSPTGKMGGDSKYTEGNASSLKDRRNYYRSMNLPEGNPLGKNPGDVWQITTQPFSEAHFAVFPEKLCVKPIRSSCPQWICKKCGKARERIIKIQHDNSKQSQEQYKKVSKNKENITEHQNYKLTAGLRIKGSVYANHKTLGWTNCDCKCPVCGQVDCKCGKKWKRGIVLDPFAGAGTTLLAARNQCRDYIGIELSSEYIKIIKNRLAQQSLF